MTDKFGVEYSDDSKTLIKCPKKINNYEQRTKTRTEQLV